VGKPGSTAPVIFFFLVLPYGISNIPVVYMTALDGSVHDRFSTAWMLHGEALFAIVCTLFALFVFGKINTAQVRAD
jgi:hypothetical protein